MFSFHRKYFFVKDNLKLVHKYLIECKKQILNFIPNVLRNRLSLPPRLAKNVVFQRLPRNVTCLERVSLTCCVLVSNQIQDHA